MTMSALPWAAAGVTGASAAATTASTAIRAIRDLRIRCLPSSRTSVRERPDAEVAADVAPEPVQSLRLQHQEHDDERAEQREPEGPDQVVHRRLREEDGPERLHGVADDDRQQRHEGRPEDR